MVNPVNIMLTADEVAFVVADCGASLITAAGDRSMTSRSAGVHRS